MPDDTDSNVVHLPARGGDSGGMPDAPDGGDLFYSEPPDSSAGFGTPPESPEETTMELPAVRAPISPEMALRQTGIPDPPDSEDGEIEEGEYVQPRSLADRLSDWLEYKLEVARDRHSGEAQFREAEIARKAALLEARTAREVAMMEQNGKLHAAMMKAKGDKAAARGKSDADRTRSSSSGLGSDKGRSKAGGGSSSGGSGRGSGGGRGSGTNGSGGGSGRGSGGGNSPKSGGKGPDRSAGRRGGGSKGNESSGGSKGRRNGSGGSGSGSGKGSSGKGSSGGSGSGSGKGKSKAEDGGKSRNEPASSPAAERARGRHERAAARQAARQQRRATRQAADLADRSKDRDQGRADRQAARDERRASKAERKAARKTKREEAKAAEDRTSLGAAVTREAQRRWDKRRADADDTPEKTDPAKDKARKSTGDKAGKKADADTKDADTDGLAPDERARLAGDSDAKASPASKDDAAKDAKDGRAPADTVIDPHKPGERPWKTPPEKEGDESKAAKDEGPREPTADKASGEGLTADTDSKSAKRNDSTEKNKTGPDTDPDGPKRDAPADATDGKPKEQKEAAGEPNGSKQPGGWQEQFRESDDDAEEDSLLGDYQPGPKKAREEPDPWVYERVRQMLYGKRGRKKKDKKGKDGRARREQARPQEPARRVRAEDLGYTVERADRPADGERPRRPQSRPPGTGS
ncbi:hypothetical protein, partial [Streptomyces chartreusis]